MSKPTVDHDYFFQNADRFPWDWYFGRPTVGNPHSHICRMLSLIVPDPDLRSFLAANPAMFELRRLEVEGMPSFITGVMTYCRRIYEDLPSDRKNVAEEVLCYLRAVTPFKEMFAETLNRRFMEGAIYVPDETLPTDLLIAQNRRKGLV